LRISESGVVRAIAKIPCLKGGLRGRVKSRAFCHDVGASVEKKRAIAARYRASRLGKSLKAAPRSGFAYLTL
jgi:hypothetical protein